MDRPTQIVTMLLLSSATAAILTLVWLSVSNTTSRSNTSDGGGGGGNGASGGSTVVTKPFSSAEEVHAQAVAATEAAVANIQRVDVGELLPIVEHTVTQPDGIQYFQYTPTTLPPPKVPPEIAFYAYQTNKIGTAPVRVHVDTANPERRMYTMRDTEPGMVADVADAGGHFYAYPMDFPGTVPVWIYENVKHSGIFKLSTSKSLAVAAPDTWKHYYSVDRPVFFAPIKK